MVYPSEFYITEIFLLVDLAIHVKILTARTPLISNFSVCFRLFDAA